MKSTVIENIKKFTAHIFTRDTFDNFLVTEASFSTSFDVSIDGHINQDYLDGAESSLPENREGVVFWKKLRPLCFGLIKGQKVPLRFKIVFMIPSSYVAKFLSGAGLNYSPDQVNALFLNVTYQDGKLVCTTGTSLKGFTLDRSLEQAWDAQMESFLIRLQER